MFTALSILAEITLFRFNPAASIRLDTEYVCGLALLMPL
jgi:hypothetical protein